MSQPFPTLLDLFASRRLESASEIGPIAPRHKCPPEPQKAKLHVNNQREDALTREAPPAILGSRREEEKEEEEEDEETEEEDEANTKIK